MQAIDKGDTKSLINDLNEYLYVRQFIIESPDEMFRLANFVGEEFKDLNKSLKDKIAAEVRKYKRLKSKTLIRKRVTFLELYFYN